MPIANCGIQFSWDCPLECTGKGPECEGCPLREKKRLIRARVIDTNEEVLLDDEPIDSWYNMWHNAENGMTYHDDDLEFIDKRLQTKNDQT